MRNVCTSQALRIPAGSDEKEGGVALSRTPTTFAVEKRLDALVSHPWSSAWRVVAVRLRTMVGGCAPSVKTWCW